jgi:hypothetical protein
VFPLPSYLYLFVSKKASIKRKLICMLLSQQNDDPKKLKNPPENFSYTLQISLKEFY